MQTDDSTPHPGLERSDSLLTRQTLAGDQNAFAVLVRRYSTPLFTYICYVLHDVTEAEDVLQHVFLKLYLALPTLNTDGPLSPWLFRVAHNRCLDEMRRKHAYLFSEVEEEMREYEFSDLMMLPDTSPSPEELAEQHELQSQVQHAIRALPPKLRAIVLLRYAGQLGFSEIAQVLGIPEATAKTYMHRAKPRLRAALSDQVERTLDAV